MDYVSQLGYDPVRSESIRSFAPVQMGTKCSFARAAKIWGSKPWDQQMSFEENVKANAAALALFLEIGKGLQLEGFLLELKSKFETFFIFSFSFSDYIFSFC